MSDQELIDDYERNAPALLATIVGMTAEQLNATPVAGKWSTQQVVIHLGDAEMAFAHRLKRILAEDQPAYSKWNENDFVARLHYDAQSAEDAAAMIELIRRQLGRVLRKMPAGALDRTGTHSQLGQQTARVVLTYAVNHLHHHLKFIDEKRAALGLARN